MFIKKILQVVVVSLWTHSLCHIDIRYCDSVEAIHNFRRTIVDEVLLKLVWHDYLLVPPSEENMKKLDNKYQVGHVQEFGRCIIDILSGLFSLEPNLLSVFCQKFEEFCLEAFLQSNNFESCENVEKIIRFLLLVDLHAVQKGETWPLSYLVGPMLSKSFQLIQTIVSFLSVHQLYLLYLFLCSICHILSICFKYLVLYGIRLPCTLLMIYKYFVKLLYY